MGNHCPRLRIQKNPVVRDCKQAGQFMADYDDGGSKTVP